MENHHNEHQKKEMDRRSVLKVLGAGALATGTGMLGCRPNTSVSPEGTATGPIPTDKMEYRINPKTGEKVSLLGYGCMRWPTQPKSDGSGNEIDQEAVNEMIDFAMAHGVNYYDTSPVYVQGMSEAATGIALARHPREKYYLATKMSNMRMKTFELSACRVMYEESFKRLKTDYLDYYLLHAIGMLGWDKFKERTIDNGLLDFTIKEREAGRIRNLGFSYHGDIKAFDYLLSRDDVKWDFVQIQLNYVDWKHATGENTNAEYLLGELSKRKIPAVIMEPLLGGRLSALPNYLMTRLKQLRPEASTASWAFRFAGTPPEVLTVLSGMTYMEHLQDNLRTYAPFEPLTEKEKILLEEIAQLYMDYPIISCNDCKYCMPCPYGIDIPQILLHYNKCVNEGNVPKSKEAENYQQARRAFLVGYDQSVPRLRQASHCTGCNQCTDHCPQKVDIAKEMVKIDRFVEALKQNKLDGQS